MYADGTGGRMKPQKSKATAQLVRLSDVAPTKVEWLWPRVIAIGKVTMLVGHPGLGKSFCTQDIAARVSTGRGWPGQPSVAREPAGVLLISSEDALDDTIRPRLDAMKADCSLIGAFNAVETSDGSGTAFETDFDLTRHIAVLEEKILEMGNCKLVVIDPISAFMGEANSNSNTEVRSIITSLSKLAERTRVAIVIVSHCRKGESLPISSVMGSMAFVAASRAAWIIVKDPDAPDRRLMLPLKNNLATDAGGFAYCIPRIGEQQGTVVWEEDRVFVDAEDILSPTPKKRGPPPTAKDWAGEWLHGILKDGPMAVALVNQQANDAGISDSTLNRARKQLGVVSRKVGNVYECALPAFVTDRSSLEPEQLEQPEELDDDGWPASQDCQDFELSDDDSSW